MPRLLPPEKHHEALWVRVLTAPLELTQGFDVSRGDADVFSTALSPSVLMMKSQALLDALLRFRALVPDKRVTIRFGFAPPFDAFGGEPWEASPTYLEEVGCPLIGRALIAEISRIARLTVPGPETRREVRWALRRVDVTLWAISRIREL